MYLELSMGTGRDTMGFSVKNREVGNTKAEIGWKTVPNCSHFCKILFDNSTPSNQSSGAESGFRDPNLFGCSRSVVVIHKRHATTAIL